MNERLKDLRKALKLNQEELGKRLGLIKSTISKLESGNSKITEQTIKLICKQFNVDYMWLTTGDREMFNNSNNGTLSIISNTLMAIIALLRMCLQP